VLLVEGLGRRRWHMAPDSVIADAEDFRVWESSNADWRSEQHVLEYVQVYGPSASAPVAWTDTYLTPMKPLVPRSL
jgi:hypothetical protein